MGRLKKIKGAEAGVEELAGLSEAAKEQAERLGTLKEQEDLVRTTKEHSDRFGAVKKQKDLVRTSQGKESIHRASKEQADLAGKAQKKVLMTRTARQQEDLAGMLVKLVRSDPSDISRKMEKRAKRIRHLTTLVQLAIRVFNAYDKKTIYRK